MDIKRFYVTEKLGPNQALTQEGFLVCANVAIARTGQMIYGPGETDIEPGPDGIVRVEREADEVFSPETIASFEGKPVVIEHPEEDVMPHNWRNLAVGHVMNVRRGTGIEDHLLLADLMITREDAIAMLRASPKYEVSCGYDSRYAKTGPGRGFQKQIRGNHLALVETGRCGTVCSTKDHLAENLAPCVKNAATLASAKSGSEGSLPAKTKDTAMSMRDALKKLRDAIATKDESTVQGAMSEAEHVMNMAGNPDDNEVHTHVHIHASGPDGLFGSPTRPEGGLPSTGETTVTSAKDAKTVGGETEATFGGKTFFDDAQAKCLDEAFEKLKVKDKARDDAFEEFKKKTEDSLKRIGDSLAEIAKAAGPSMGASGTKTTDDSAAPAEGAGTSGNKEIEGELEEEAPPGTGDKARKARDSEFMEYGFDRAVAGAEILVPGIAIPTFDRAAAPGTTLVGVCGLRKKALSGYIATKDGAEVVAEINGGRTLDSASVTAMPCRDAARIFSAAVAVQKGRNNAAAAKPGATDGSYFKSRDTASAAPMSLADLNRLNAQHAAATFGVKA